MTDHGEFAGFTGYFKYAVDFVGLRGVCCFIVFFFFYCYGAHRDLHSFPTRRSSDLTHDGKRLIMSDGSSTLYFWDPKTLKEIGHLDVDDKGKSVPNLNELEYIRGEIYANVWQTERIARISPATGHVISWIDLSGLLGAAERSRAEVLNGIAYD